MNTLCVANQKGGVGKSTLTVHLAYAALEQGLRVLLVDMDRQGSLSLTFPWVPNSPPGITASSLYVEEQPGEPEYLNETLAIIRADASLLSIDKADNTIIRYPRQALRQFSSKFDVCLIDTPPLLGIRLMASLAASDFVVTPVSVGLYELAGVSDLLQTIKVVVSNGLNPRLKHLGILPMKTNTRSSDEAKALAMLRARYDAMILPEMLPERAQVRQAIARRVPVWKSPRGEGHRKAAAEWRAACNSILQKI